MNKFKIGDKVIIKGTRDIWEGKTGKVLEESPDEVITKDNIDLTEVIVSIDFNDKNVVQSFPRDNVELYNINENKQNLQEYFEMRDVEEFKNNFIGKQVVFTGFPYSDYYQMVELSKGEYGYKPEDQEDIDFYKSLEGKVGVIDFCDIDDGFENYQSDKDNFESCYWTVKYPDDKELECISGQHLMLIDKESLTEAVDPKLAVEIDHEAELEKAQDEKVQELTEDYIYDYVHFVDLDDNEIPSWYFVNKIAAAENIDEDKVISDAIKLKKYQIYSIKSNNNFSKLIILAPKCKLEDVYADYINYIPGTVSITEVF